MDTSSKIKGIRELARIVGRIRSQGKKVVFTNGCFDLLHYGHVQYLEKARAMGDVLVVALNSDASVRRLKGNWRPVVGQHDRARVLAGLASVGLVTVFGDDTPERVIRAVRPDCLVKGADWKTKDIAGADFVRSYGAEVRIIRLAQGRSTSTLIEKIRHAAAARG